MNFSRYVINVLSIIIESCGQMKHTLPFEISAHSIAYHNKAFPLGIMKANLLDFDTWICNNLINSIYETDKNCYNIYDDDIWSYK